MARSLHLTYVAVLSALLGLASCGIDSNDPQLSQTNQDSVVTNLSTYVSGDNIVVTYSGMQGTSSDWLVIAHPTDPPTNYEDRLYTTPGTTSGTVTFNSAREGAGTYEIRAYYNWYGTHAYTVQQTSPSFTITGGPALTPSASSFAVNSPVTINYAGFSGRTTDWVAIYTPGAPDTSYTAKLYTNGTVNGSVTFASLPAGTWEARYHANLGTAPNYGALAYSTQFTVRGTTAIRTDFTNYGTGQSIVATYSNMPGNALDYVAVSAAGAPASSTIQRFYTNGQINGTQTFSPLPSGNYEARAYANDSTTAYLVKSNFTVTSTTITTDQTMYTTGQPITVTWSGMPASTSAFVTIATQGSGSAIYVQKFSTGGAPSGSHQFTGLAAGTYEARAYYDTSWVVQARSAPFTIGTACTVPTMMPVLSGITSGTLTLAATDQQVTVPVTVDLASSVLFTTVDEREPSPKFGNVLCELNAMGVHCQRNNLGTDTGSGVINVKYNIATFASGVSVQRGIANTNAASTQTVALTAIDPTSSFVVMGGGFNGGTGWGNNEFVSARILDSTSLEVATSFAGSQAAWQVVTMTGASVTRGSTSLSSAQTAASVTIPAVASGSMLLASYTSDNSTGIAAGALMVQSQLQTSSLSFTRVLGGSNISIDWEVVSLPFATHLGVSSFNAGDANASASVTGIAAATSVALSSSQSILGQSGGSTAYNGSDTDLVGEAAFSMQTTAGGLSLTRQSTSSSASVAWTVIDFAHNCAGM